MTTPARSAAAAPRAPGVPLVVLGIAVAISVAHSLLLARAFAFNNVDDAYIAFRYGWNLMHGQGLVFNPGDHVEGYTSFLWTVFMAPWTVAPADIVWFSIAFGVVASGISLWAVAAHVRAQRAAGGTEWLLAALPMTALDGSHAFWAIGGLETSAFTALFLWALYGVIARRGARAAWGTGALFGLAALTRPEGWLLFVLVVAHQAFTRDRPARRDVAIWAAAFAIVAIPHLLWRHEYYGEWLPNTYYNKVSFEGRAVAAGWAYLGSGLAWRFGAPLAALLALTRPEVARRMSLYLVVVGGYLAYVVVIGGDWVVANRFFVPILPLVYLLAVAGVVAWVRAPVARAVALAALGLGVALGTYLHAEPARMVRENRNVIVETQRKRFGVWLRTAMPPQTLIATGPSGAIPYYSRLRCIDMWGLTDRHIARMPRTSFLPGHDRTDLEYVLAQHPQLIIGDVGLHSGDEIPAGYSPVNDLIPEADRPTELVIAGGASR